MQRDETLPDKVPAEAFCTIQFLPARKAVLLQAASGYWRSPRCPSGPNAGYWRVCLQVLAGLDGGRCSTGKHHSRNPHCCPGRCVMRDARAPAPLSVHQTIQEYVLCSASILVSTSRAALLTKASTKTSTSCQESATLVIGTLEQFELEYIGYF